MFADALDAWGVGEGDELALTERGLRPAIRGGFHTRSWTSSGRRKASNMSGHEGS
jgi:hypothetical protein